MPPIWSAAFATARLVPPDTAGNNNNNDNNNGNKNNNNTTTTEPAMQLASVSGNGTGHFRWLGFYSQRAAGQFLLLGSESTSFD